MGITTRGSFCRRPAVDCRYQLLIQEIAPRATFHSLRESLAEEGADLLVSTLHAMAVGTVRPTLTFDWIWTQTLLIKAVPTSQDPTRTTLAPFIRRSFTQINWDTWDAQRLDRVHRAAHHQVNLPQFSFVTAEFIMLLQHALVTFLPYSPTLQIEQFTISSPPASLHPRLKQAGDAIYDPHTQSLIVRCAGQTEISVTLVQQENKRVLGANDFWNGIRPDGLQHGILKLHSSYPP